MPQIRYQPIYPKLTYDQKKEKSGRWGGKMQQILCSVWSVKTYRWDFSGLVHAQHLLWIPLHSWKWGSWQCFLGNNNTLAYSTQDRCLWLCLHTGSLLHDTQTTFFCQHSLHFHSTGHSKCSQACFLTTYTNVNPELARINSSAAECGLGRLGSQLATWDKNGQLSTLRYTFLSGIGWSLERCTMWSSSTFDVLAATF